MCHLLIHPWIFQWNWNFPLNVHNCQFYFLLGELSPGVLHPHGQHGLTVLCIFCTTFILSTSPSFSDFPLSLSWLLDPLSPSLSLVYSLIKLDHILQYLPGNSAWELIFKHHSCPQNIFIFYHTQLLVWKLFPSEFRSIVHFLLLCMVVVEIFDTMLIPSNL